MSKIVAVTGITGHTGGFLLKEFIRNHFEECLRCLVRPSSNTFDLDHSGLNVEKVVGSVEDEEILASLVRDTDVVFHIVGIRFSNLLTKIVLREKVKRLILVHTTGIFSKYKMAAGDYKRTESELFQMTDGKDLDLTILRPTMIFGDLCDLNISKFIRLVDCFPIMPEINHGCGKLQPVNARDLGRAYYRVIQTDHLPQRDYILSGECQLSMHELFVLIGRYLGKSVRFLNCPMPIGVFLARMTKCFTLGKIDKVEQVLRMGEDRVFSHEAASRDLDYRPESFKEGLKREVEAYLQLPRSERSLRHCVRNTFFKKDPY